MHIILYRSEYAYALEQVGHVGPERDQVEIVVLRQPRRPTLGGIISPSQEPNEVVTHKSVWFRRMATGWEPIDEVIFLD